MAKSAALHRASKAKNDEFYTQLADIEAELKHYKKHFQGKTVFCNCDDPYESNFFKYFAMNFRHLGLKKLIATCYHGSPVAGEQFSVHDLLGDPASAGRRSYKIEITEVPDGNGDGVYDLADVMYLLRHSKNALTPLKGDGDFRSPECVAILQEADIVVTNPPFSLFREYVMQLMEYNKSFIIIGNQNAITYKEIFPLLKENRMWLGYRCGDMAFTVPEYCEPRPTRYWVDANGQKWRSMGNICWFTNLDIQKRHEPLELWKKYSPDEYPHYDNYDAIEVSKTDSIPMDYFGVMGVPITFLDKYCPTQFEIIRFRKGDDGKDVSINGKSTYFRILIRRKDVPNEN